MNRAFRTAVVLVMAASVAGCVSSGKFNKLKAEQDVLKNEKAEGCVIKGQQEGVWFIFDKLIDVFS